MKTSIIFVFAILLTATYTAEGKQYTKYKKYTLGYGCAKWNMKKDKACWAYCGISWVSWPINLTLHPNQFD